MPASTKKRFNPYQRSSNSTANESEQDKNKYGELLKEIELTKNGSTVLMLRFLKVKNHSSSGYLLVGDIREWITTSNGRIIPTKNGIRTHWLNIRFLMSHIVDRMENPNGHEEFSVSHNFGFVSFGLTQVWNLFKFVKPQLADLGPNAPKAYYINLYENKNPQAQSAQDPKLDQWVLLVSASVENRRKVLLDYDALRALAYEEAPVWLRAAVGAKFDQFPDLMSEKITEAENNNNMITVTGADVAAEENVVA